MCEFTIVRAERRPDSIFIEGTSDCDTVSVRINLPDTTALTSPVDGEGHWEVEFTENEVPDLDRVTCPDRIKTDIHCVDDLSCKGPDFVDLECAGATCPQIGLALTEMSPCDANDQQTATFEVTVTGAPNPTILSIDFGDGTDETIVNSEVQASGGGPILRQHSYDPGSYTVVVSALFPEGCADSNPVTLAVRCEIACPEDIAFEIEAADGKRYRTVSGTTGPYEEITDGGGGEVRDCLPGGDATVVLAAPAAAGLGITWRQDDDPPQVTDQATFVVTLGSGAEMTVNATLTKDGCPPLSEPVVLQGCGCEPTAWSEWSECDACEQRRTRTLADCTTETETRACTQDPGPWTPWRRSWFCGASRSREGADCTTETQSRVNWCCVWMWITLGLIAATGILIFITLCMLPATFWSALAAVESGGGLAPVWAALTASNIGMLIASGAGLLLSIASLVLWLIFCVFGNSRDAACFLLGIFIQVMAWLTSISALVAAVLWVIALLCGLNVVCLFQAVGCAVGATIDVGWFGVILSVAVIIQSFLCGGED